MGGNGEGNEISEDELSEDQKDSNSIQEVELDIPDGTLSGLARTIENIQIPESTLASFSRATKQAHIPSSTIASAALAVNQNQIPTSTIASAALAVDQAHVPTSTIASAALAVNQNQIPSSTIASAALAADRNQIPTSGIVSAALVTQKIPVTAIAHSMVGTLGPQVSKQIANLSGLIGSSIHHELPERIIDPVDPVSPELSSRQISASGESRQENWHQTEFFNTLVLIIEFAIWKSTKIKEGEDVSKSQVTLIATLLAFMIFQHATNDVWKAMTGGGFIHLLLKDALSSE